MKQIAKYAVPALLAASLTFGVGTGSTTAAAADEEPCTAQAAKVAKAEDALARVTAVFEKQAAKVKKAKEEVDEADTEAEETEAEEDLEAAKEKKAKAKKAKKAQKMRLEKAQQRLDACLADQEPVEG
jgi:hypothetical protein